MGDFLNFSSGQYVNFVEDTIQSSNYIAPSDSKGSAIEVSIEDVTRFTTGNIVQIDGVVYKGNFSVNAIWQRPNSNSGTLFINTPYIFKSPTSVKDSSWANGYVDKEKHSIKNLTRFHPVLIEYGKKLDSIKGKSYGGRDKDVFGITSGIVRDTYQKFKKDDLKGALSKAEVDYIKPKAIKCCDTIDGKYLRKDCKQYVDEKYPKLWDGITLETSTTLNDAGGVSPINQSAIAQQFAGQKSGSSASSSVKYVFLGIAGIGVLLLVRSLLKK